MNTKMLNLIGVAGLALSALAACGGSSDDGAGSLTPFTVTPESLVCRAGIDFGMVTVVGGMAPYTLRSSSSSIVLKAGAASDADGPISRLGNEGDQFSAWGGSTCPADDASITVIDGLGRVKSVKVAASGA